MRKFHTIPDACFAVGRKAALAVFRRYGRQNGLECEDLLQIAAAAVIEQVPRYRAGSKSLTSWLYMPVYRAVLDGIREADEVGRTARERGERGPTVSLEHPTGGRQQETAEPGERGTVGGGLAAPVIDGGEAALEQLGESMAGLSVEARAALYLGEIVDLDAGQIAAVLGCSARGVWPLIERAKAAMRLFNGGARSARPSRGEGRQHKRTWRTVRQLPLYAAGGGDGKPLNG